MARRGEGAPTEERVRRGVRRTLANAITLLLSIGVLVAWGSLGVYQLQPGQAGVILRFGRYSRTVAQPGLQLHLPPPIEAHEIVNVGAIERVEFGTHAVAEPELAGERLLEATMQTSDNNIVNLGFVVQYQVKDAFAARYRIADPESTLRDAAQAAVREVVGRTSIDGVLSEQRGVVEAESEEILQGILDRYDSGLAVLAIQLQEVQPPAAVRDAFDDVIAASQDRSRAVNEAQGYANEVLPKARGEASELRAAAQGYREARIAEATGEAERFRAVLVQYQIAPEVTRKRLYLETMEAVLPAVETVIIEPGAASVLPYLPLGRDAKPPARGAAEPAR